MFNLFWRPYVPGFRVRPQEDVPGFNIDENGLPRRSRDWSDGMLPDAATQRYPDTVRTEMPYSVSVPTPGPEGMVQSAPSIGLAGFRANPQGYIPGFNVEPGDDVPGFDLDDDVEEQETIWSSQTSPPNAEEPVQPIPPRFPEWAYNFIARLPQLLATFDPITARRGAINSLPGMPSAKPPDAAQPASSSVPQPLAGPDIDSRTVAMRATASQPASREAMSSVWRRPQTGGWRYTQAPRLDNPWSPEITRQPKGLPPMIAAKPVEGANFILASDRAAGEQTSRPTLLEYQQRQLLAPVGTAIAEVDQPPMSGMRPAPLENEPERMPSPFMGANRPPLAVEGGAEDSPLIAQAYAQVDKPQVASRVDLFRRDAAGLPIGTILSSIRSPDYIGGDAINSIAPNLRLSRDRSSVGAIAPDDLNVHLVGDGNSLEDVPRDQRHLRGVEASIADHVAKGFKLVARGPRAVDVPGFSSPRLYDYIIQDPVTGLYYGVEVKTTIMSTIRVDREQVLKDAAVVAQGARVRVLGIDLYGVSYSVYCFGCEALDVRSARLLSILQNAGVPVVPGILPGDIRP